MEGFKNVLATAKRSLDSLQFGTESILSPAQQLSNIFSGPDGINNILSINPADRTASDQQRLTELLPQVVRLAREGFGEGSAAEFAAFTFAQEKLNEIQSIAVDRQQLQLDLMSSHESLLMRIEEINNREFEVSERLNQLIQENQKEQIALMEAQEALAEEQVEGINRVDESVKALQSTITKVASRPNRTTIININPFARRT